MNKRITSSLFRIFAVFLALTVSTSHAAILDKVAAIVDDDIIMLSELDIRLAGIYQNIQQQGGSLPPEDALQTEVLNQMIVENLQLQMGRRYGIEINPAQLDHALNNLARNVGLPLEPFKQRLKEQGQYQATAARIERELIIRQVQNGNIAGRIQVTPQEVKAYLDTPEGIELSQPRYFVSHLMIPVASPDQRAAAEKTLEKAAQQINLSLPLGQWAQSYNKAAATPVQGGDLGWRTANDLPTIFADIVPNLTTGEVAGPIDSGNGLHLIQLMQTTGGAKLVKQTHARHILIKPSEIRTETEVISLLKSLRNSASNGADFAELAKKHTEDIASAQEGGDLGWSSPGQFVPSFEQTMASTKVGDISPPFKSQYGWHILQVMERREKDISGDIIDKQAKNAIFDRKFQDELENWLQKIRDEAYVDIRI